jgi:site-specific DNA-methyltransferase (adenine-specific)
VDFSNAKDCFPGVSIGGGVCYFLWSRDVCEDCLYTNIHDGITSVQKRRLDEFPVFVRYNEALSIIHNVKKKSKRFVSEIMGGRNPFGFESFARGANKKSSIDKYTLYYSGGVGYVSSEDITKGRDLLKKYKVMISRATAEHAGEADMSGMYNVLSVIKTLKPNEVCSDSYLIAYTSDVESMVGNFYNYARTKFFRFLVLQSVSSISLSKEKFCFVPILDFNIRWTDEMLYKEFSLTEQEINFIESMIKEK